MLNVLGDLPRQIRRLRDTCVHRSASAQEHTDGGLMFGHSSERSKRDSQVAEDW